LRSGRGRGIGSGSLEGGSWEGLGGCRRIRRVLVWGRRGFFLGLTRRIEGGRSLFILVLVLTGLFDLVLYG